MSTTASSLPIWVEYARALGPLFVAVTIGGFGSHIAWRQWKTNQNNFREKLFDRRFEIFEKTEALAGRIFSGRSNELPGEVGLEQSLAEFHSVRRRSKFLFAGELDECLEKIHNLMIDVHHNRLHKQHHAEAQKELMNLYRNLPEDFRAFLAFK